MRLSGRAAANDSDADQVLTEGHDRLVRLCRRAGERQLCMRSTQSDIELQGRLWRLVVGGLELLQQLHVGLDREANAERLHALQALTSVKTAHQDCFVGTERFTGPAEAPYSGQLSTVLLMLQLLCTCNCHEYKRDAMCRI